jgi:hypothetical protein
MKNKKTVLSVLVLFIWNNNSAKADCNAEIFVNQINKCLTSVNKKAYEIKDCLREGIQQGGADNCSTAKVKGCVCKSSTGVECNIEELSKQMNKCLDNYVRTSESIVHCIHAGFLFAKGCKSVNMKGCICKP